MPGSCSFLYNIKKIKDLWVKISFLKYLYGQIHIQVFISHLKLSFQCFHILNFLLRNFNAFQISCNSNIWQTTPEIHDLINQSHYKWPRAWLPYCFDGDTPLIFISSLQFFLWLNWLTAFALQKQLCVCRICLTVQRTQYNEVTSFSSCKADLLCRKYWKRFFYY